MSQTTTCPMCAASLAPDQRYCLSCGTRVATPRLDFLAESERAEAEARSGSAPVGAAAAASGAPSAAEAPAATAPAPSRLDKVGGPMGAAAVVLVALGVGFLIGQTRTDAQPEQKAPVVNIESGVTSGSATTPATTDLPTADATTGDAAATDDAPAAGDAATTDDAPATADAAPTDAGATSR